MKPKIAAKRNVRLLRGRSGVSEAQETTTKEPFRTCGKCDSIFLNEGDFAAHAGECPGSVEAKARRPKFEPKCHTYPRRCNDCGQVFAIKYKFYDHRKSFKPCNGVPKIFQTKRSERSECRDCGKVLASEKGLMKHYKLVHPEVLPEEMRLTKEYPCRVPGCDRVFQRTHSRSYHELTHKDESKSLICDQCGSKFITKQKLKRHVLLHSSESVRCPSRATPDCAFILENLEKFMQHCEKCHPNEVVEPVQNVPRTFTKPTNHTRPHTGPRRQRTKTTDAHEKQANTEMMTYKENLTYLEVDNEGNIVHYTDDDQDTSQEDNNVVHAEILHIPETEAKSSPSSKLQFLKMYHCKPCGVVFVDQEHLVGHMLDSHGDIVEEIEVGGMHGTGG